MKKKNKGFSLIELLATLFIISIVFSISTYFVMNTINNSKDKASITSINGIKKSANLYVKEYPENITWNNNKACVYTKDLIEYGYLKPKQIKDTNTYVIITKNESNTIIKEQLDTEGVCQAEEPGVPIPNANFCIEGLTYNNKEHELLIIPNTETGFTFTDKNGNVGENIKGKNAGEYQITAKLTDKENNNWKDGTKEDKTIICSIQKTTPTLSLYPKKTYGSVGNKQEVTLTSDVPGKLAIKSTNKNFATGSLDKNTITNGETRKVTIETFATRDIATYINITLTPDDTKNYYTTTTTYTLDYIDKTKIIVPTSKYCQDNLSFNGKTQELVKPKEELEELGINTAGINFKNTKGKAMGEYTITASLNYGYIWATEKGKTLDTKDKTFNCSINKKGSNLTVLSISGDEKYFEGDTTSGELAKNHSATITLQADTAGTINISNTSTSINVSKTKGTITKENGTFDLIVTGKAINSNINKLNFSFTPTDTKNYTSSTTGYEIKIVEPKTYTYKINYMSGNLIYNLYETTDNTQTTGATYKIKKDGNNTNITVTSTKDNGFVKTIARVYLYANRKYIFNCDECGIFGQKTGTDTTEVNLLLDGKTETYYNMKKTNNYQFTPTTSGFYWIRLDVNLKGKTYTFKNISLQTEIATKLVNNGSKYTLPNNPSYYGLKFLGWYTSIYGGTNITNNTTKTTDKDEYIYGHWDTKKLNIVFHRNQTATDSLTTTKTYTFGSLNDQKLTDNGWTKTGYTLTQWELRNPENKFFNKTATVNNDMINGRSPQIDLYGVWSSNTCTIIYNPVEEKGGKFNLSAQNEGNITQETKYIDENTNIIVRSANNFYHVTNNGGYTYNSEKNKNAWIAEYSDGTKKQFQNYGTYKINTICPNIKTKSETVTLKVDWIPIPPTISFSPNGGSYLSGKRVSITCHSDAGIESFITIDNTGDLGYAIETTTNERTRGITLVSGGARSIIATCNSKNGESVTGTKYYTITVPYVEDDDDDYYYSGGGGGYSGGGSSYSGGGSSSSGRSSSGRRGGGCFTAGTKVLTQSGYKNIEKLTPIDRILSYNEKLKVNEYQKITNIFVFPNKEEELYEITTDNATIKATEHHRFYLTNKKSYINAKDLSINDTVLYEDGTIHQIKNIKHHKINQTVYNLEIEKNHNFYVGEKGILVHNMQFLALCTLRQNCQAIK